MNDLIESCVDAHDYYEFAREKVVHKQPKKVFVKGVKLHETIISELGSYIAINNGSVDTDGILKGKAAQIVGQLKTFVQHTDLTLVQELQKLEHLTSSKFELALEDSLPHEVISLIGKQVMRLKNNHEHLRNLEYYLKNLPDD